METSSASTTPPARWSGKTDRNEESETRAASAGSARSPTDRDPVSDDALLNAYRSTRWRVRTPSGTLSLQIGAPFPLTDLGIVTACNPRSTIRTRAENRTANRRLLRRLRRSGARFCFASAGGVGPQAAQWREPGFAVELGRTELVALAGEFGQNAIVWVPRSGVATLVVTREGFAGQRVGAVV
jgi:hypothetical protein